MPTDSNETIFILPEGILSSIYLEDLQKFKTLFSKSFSKKHKIILGMNIYEKQKELLKKLNRNDWIIEENQKLTKKLLMIIT